MRFRAFVLPVAAGLVAGACGEGPIRRAEPIARVTQPVVPPVAEDAKLTAPSGFFDDRFGEAVAVSGDTVVVGAPGADLAGAGAGAVYVFVRDGATWPLQATLTGRMARDGDGFGARVDIDGDTIVVGQPEADSTTVTNVGGVYVFRRSGTTWSEETFLQEGTTSFQQYGEAVSMSGDALTVGANGSGGGGSGMLYIYERSGVVWNQVFQQAGTGLGNFARFVTMDGDYVISTQDDAGANVVVFERHQGSWTIADSIFAPEAQQASLEGIRLGVRVGSSAGFVAAFRREGGGGCGPGGGGLGGGGTGAISGSGGVGNIGGGTGCFRHQNTIASPLSGTSFGTGLAVSGDAFLVGAPLDDTMGNNAGIVHVYTNDMADTFTPAGTISPSDAAAEDRFGTSVAADGAVVVVGAPEANGSVGAAYVFVEPRADGAPCLDGSTCDSGFCVDGACCNVACAGVCESCSGADTGLMTGTCGAVLDGTDPDDDCTDDGAATCGDDGSCDGAGACRKYPTSTACVPAPCSDGSECTSGFCVVEAGQATGICCDTACSGACETCRASLQEAPGEDGVCAPIRAGIDPRDGCPDPPVGTQSCGPDGTCDGAGACRRYAADGAPCGTTLCQAGGVFGQLCDGAGSCVADASSECLPYRCDDLGVACRADCSSDVHCAADHFCAGVDCVAEKDDGAPCAEGKECSSGICVDGVCCNEACGAQCVACNVEGSIGRCTAVTGEPRGGREPCEGQGTDCGGSCDGVNPTCTLPLGTECGTSTCNGNVAETFACDGLGACVPEPDETCFPYACDNGACNTDCLSDDDCEAPASCDAEISGCITVASCDGDHTVTGASGDTTDCTPYRCSEDDDICLSTCESILDCVSGFVCSSDGDCVQGIDDGGSDEGGCGCAVPGAPVRAPWTVVALAGLAALLRRRLS